MARRPQKNHLPAYKAKLALEALKGEQNISRIGSTL
jgi:hypothetical protein